MERYLSEVLLQGNVLFYCLVFLSGSLFSVAIGTLTLSWFDIRRRAVNGRGLSGADGGSVQIDLLAGTSGSFAALEVLLPKKESDKSELRRYLNLAGYYGAGAPVIYQLIRISLGLTFGIGAGFIHSRLFPVHPFFITIAVSLLMALLGYMLPQAIVSIRRDRLCTQHRQGFPDFLDLLVICVEAGIGIDSAMERVGRDLDRNYPSLAKNLGLMSLEMRAGRSTKDALHNLGERLGIDEAKSFARLIQQSEELGSSLVQSLRIYSDEMRAKRLAKAEEKAMALPAKLVIPLGFFIFPVILGVTLLPVAIKVYKALGI